ncbi:MAG: cupin domain-containing protein [Alloacidobacterium sp.]|jgi:quercetin dioxygenase-like cupin family protein
MRRTTSLALFKTGIVVTALYYAGNVPATPAVGFAATTIMSGTFGEIDLTNKSIVPDSSENDRQAKAWLSQQKTAGPSDLYVQSNVWQPGGTTGWHTHPGNSLIIVTAGTVTEYEGPDPGCKPHAYTKGMTFADPHADHVHIIRNEGNIVARTTAVQLIPAGATRRIDVADPGNCHF